MDGFSNGDHLLVVHIEEAGKKRIAQTAVQWQVQCKGRLPDSLLLALWLG